MTIIDRTPTETTPLGFSAALGATLLWAVGNVAIAGAPIDALPLAFHRLWIAAVVYGVVLHLSGRRLTLDSFRYGMAGSIVFAVDIVAFFLAVQHTTVADATTIAALQPVVILFFAGNLFGERIRPRHVICTVVAIIGIAGVVRGSASSGSFSLFGEIMAVVALFAWAWYFIASKQARRHLDTLEYLTVVMIGGVPIVGVLALATGAFSEPGNQLDLTNLWWVLLVVFLPGSGHLLINWAHNFTTITLSSLLTLLMPVVSTALAALWLDEQVTAIQVVGIAVVLGALAIVIVGDTRAAVIDAASAEEGPHV